MAQEKDNFAHESGRVEYLPKASTDINPGDVVVAPVKRDPISVAVLGPTIGRIEPIAAEREGQWVVGVAQGKNTSAALGAALYATPTAGSAVMCKTKGNIRLAIVSTSGRVGDLVHYSSGASASQLFDIDNTHRSSALAVISKDFSGASANDTQLCELIEKAPGDLNLYYFLENKVISGCEILPQSTGTAISDNIAVGVTANAHNVFLLAGVLHSNGSDRTLDIGICSVAGQSAFAAKWIVARSGGFAARTCSGIHSAFASYTAATISAGMMIPATFTVGEILIGLALRFSVQSYTAGLLHNVLTPTPIPRVGSWGI